ncbi:Inositol phosphatase SIW14 [Thecaphora frezii]
MVSTSVDAPIVGDPEVDPKAALHWLAKQRHQPTRVPYQVVQCGELALSNASLVSSLSQDELWAFLEQVGAAAIELGKWELAELCVSRLQSRFPASARVRCLQGMLLEGKGEYTRALEFYESELERDGTQVSLSRRLIATLKELPASHPRGGIQKAIEALNKHLDVFYQDPEGWQELAEMYTEIGQYQQSAFALEELLLLVPQNSFFQLKLAETLYTAGSIARSYKSYLRVLEMCKSDDGLVDGSANGPWLRALWGTKMCTSTLISQPTLLATKVASSISSPGTEDISLDKVKAIDQLVTKLLLEKVYSPALATQKSDSAKQVRDVVRKVLGA